MPRIRVDDIPKTFEEYLEAEAREAVRHEFVDGFMFMMAGASDSHNLIAGNIFAFLHAAARGSGCRVYMNDMKLRTPNETGYYPDVMLICDEADEGRDIKRCPCVIVEVLSGSTEDVDRGEKWLNYQSIPCLKLYVVVSQRERRFETFRKGRDGTWQYRKLEDDEAKLEFECLGVSMTLAEVYENVRLENAPLEHP